VAIYNRAETLSLSGKDSQVLRSPSYLNRKKINFGLFNKYFRKKFEDNIGFTVRPPSGGEGCNLVHLNRLGSFTLRQNNLLKHKTEFLTVPTVLV